jgi:predicted Zn-dependent protease with MMP-like domain
LLGLYHGVPQTARGDIYGIGMTLPDTITLFQIPIEEEAGNDPERIKQVVADTIWHEVGHYFGLDEDAVERRERERGVR